MGHEDPFPRPGPNGRCRFGQETFAGVRANGRDAPEAVFPTIRIRQRCSTLSGHSKSHSPRRRRSPRRVETTRLGGLVAPRQVFMEIPSLIVRLRACRPTSWDDTGDNGGVRLDITVTCLAGYVECDLPLPKTPKSAILASKSPGILTNID